MRAWWFNLSDRERYMLIGGGIIAGILIFYFFIWSPINNFSSNALVRLNNQRNLLTWVNAANERVQRYRAAGVGLAKDTQTSLLVLSERSLSQSRLSQYLAQVQQPANDKIQLTFRHVPFDQWVTWLDQLSHQYAIGVVSANVKKDPITGVVNAQITLSR